jgi:hypothetical protein
MKLKYIFFNYAFNTTPAGMLLKARIMWISLVVIAVVSLLTMLPLSLTERIPAWGEKGSAGYYAVLRCLVTLAVIYTIVGFVFYIRLTSPYTPKVSPNQFDYWGYSHRTLSWFGQVMIIGIITGAIGMDWYIFVPIITVSIVGLVLTYPSDKFFPENVNDTEQATNT